MRGLPPTKRSFKVISLTVRRRFLYPIPNLSQRDKGIKITFSPKSHVAFLMVLDPITQGMEKLWIRKFRWQLKVRKTTRRGG